MLQDFDRFAYDFAILISIGKGCEVEVGNANAVFGCIFGQGFR